MCQQLAGQSTPCPAREIIKTISTTKVTTLDNFHAGVITTTLTYRHMSDANMADCCISSLSTFNIQLLALLEAQVRLEAAKILFAKTF